MRYSVAQLKYSFQEQWQQDVFEQALCDLGFEVFDGSDAYIPTSILQANQDEINALITDTIGVELIGLQDCADEDWNAVWEAEHPAEELPLGVVIVPHCAFGAGHHETTSMLIDALIERQGAFRQVLDMGCGTGVLAIFAKKCGAASVWAVDMDENSVRNTQENAQRNAVCLDVCLGDTPPKGKYDLIVANIHRNILLEQLPLYAQYLYPNGEVWLSGFYSDDIPSLIEKAQEAGLKECGRNKRGEWYMLQLKK